MKPGPLAAKLCLCALLLASRGEAWEGAEGAVAAPRVAVRVPAFEDIAGRIHLSPRRSGSDVLVFAWTGVDCPMAKVYAPRLRDLAGDYAPRGVRFFVIDSNSYDALEALRGAAAALEGRCAVVRDADGALARAFGARSTTEVFVLDRERRLVYRGAIDDQYGFRREGGAGAGTYRKPAPARSYLRQAIEAALEGKPCSPAVTDPLGCALEWAAVPVEGPGTAPAGPITFHEHITPLLQRHCQDCHRRGGVAPFALVDYADARGRARMLREVVEARRMPPWNANPDVGSFANDPSLSEEAIALIARWAAGGAAEGDAAKAPPPRRFENGWGIGTPDAILTAPAFDVPADGSLPYRYVRIPTAFGEDRWVEAAQVRSTTPGIVHHVLVFLEGSQPPPDGAQRPWRPPFNPFSLLEGAPPSEYGAWIRRFRRYIRRDLMVGEGGGLNGFFVSSTEGSRPLVYPEGRAKLLPSGASLVLQIHYTPDGVPRRSETSVALRFAGAPPRQAVDCRSIATVVFAIPPGDADFVVQATNTFLRDGLVLSLRPHMHLRGRSFRYVAELPDGKRETLLEVPRYDFDWQLEYVLAEPRRLPKGTVLRAIGAFDNSAANPYNPDPTKTVYFGLQTEEEMMIGYYEVVWLDDE